MHHGKYHLHIRKRIQKKGEDYPHQSIKIRLLDRTCIVFSILMPMTALPQIYKTYALQDVTGVSLLMWVLYCIGCIPFLLYGLAHKEKPIIILNILWLIMQVTMIIGIILYS